MKAMIAVLGCAFVASCAALPSSPPPAPPVPSITVVLIEKTPEQPKAAIVTTNVVKDYRKAAQKEIPAVTAPDATPERVHRVNAADREAVRALNRLEMQGRHPTKEALDAARRAVKELSDELNLSSE